MTKYTLFLRSGSVINFNSEQTLKEITNELNSATDKFIRIGEAYCVQLSEIAGVIDNSQASKF